MRCGVISHQGFYRHDLLSRPMAALVSEPACCGTAFPAHSAGTFHRPAASVLSLFQA